MSCSASVHFLFVRCSCCVDCFCVFFVLNCMALVIFGSGMSTTRKLSAGLTPSRFNLLISTSSWPEVSRFQWPRGLGLGLRPLACWDCMFESRRGHGCLSLVNVVCCQVDVSAMGRSLVQRSCTECGVSECDRGTSTMRMRWPTRLV